MRAGRLCIAVLVGALAAAAGACAGRRAERPTVVVLEVKGEADEAWQRRVIELAHARRFDILPAETYWAAAKRLRARPLTRRNVARVATSVGATAVLHGRVSGRKKRRQVVTIYVRDGESGRVVETHRVLVRRGKAVRRSETALERRLLASLPDPPATDDERSPPASPAEARRTAAAPHAKPGDDSAASPAPPARDRGAARRTPPDPAARRDSMPRVKYDQRGQAVDDEVPPVRAR